MCRFDRSVPPVYIGQTTFAPVAATCTLYHQQAFWGMLLPCLTRPLRCVIIRQYVVQRLLREVDGFTGFRQIQAAFGKSHINTPSSLADVSDLGPEEDFDALAVYLDKWMCSPEMTFFLCIEALARDLLQDAVIGDYNVGLVQSWVVALRAAGMPEPTRVRTPWRGVRKVGENRVVLGDLRAVLEMEKPQIVKYFQHVFVDNITAECGGEDQIPILPPVTQWKRPLYEDIVLVVIFNWNKFFWKNLPFLETMHRPFFKYDLQ